MRKVFIATSTDTRGEGQFLSRELESRGISNWLDSGHLVPGKPWQAELERALAESEDYIILVGPKSDRDRRQEFEWQGALRNTWSNPQKRLIPVLFGTADTPAFLQNWTAVRVGGELQDSIDGLVSLLESSSEAPNAIQGELTHDADRERRFRQLEDMAKSLRAEEVS